MSTPEEHFQRIVAAAQEYRRHGWYPVPLTGKAPRVADWPNLRLSIEDIPGTFRPGDNLGLILGEPSAHLVDVDLDSAYAVRLAPYLLPATPMRHGRKGTGVSHYWYACQIPAVQGTKPGIKRFQAALAADAASGAPAGKTTLIEVRYSGGQTMVPPSIHPSGEPVQWAKGAELKPASVQARELYAAAQQVAALCLLARQWLPGQRNELAMWLGGWWAKSGIPAERAETLTTALCAAVQDDEPENRLGAVRASYERHAHGETVMGWQELSGTLGAETLNQAAKWLGLAGHSGRPPQPSVFGVPGADGNGPVKGRTGVNPYRYELSLLLRLTDDGNAGRFLALYGEQVLHCELLGGWYVWEGAEGRWVLDTTHRVSELACQCARQLSQEALDLSEDVQVAVGSRQQAAGSEEDGGHGVPPHQDADTPRQVVTVPWADARALYCHWATQTLNSQRMEAMLALAAGDRRVAVKPDQLDSDPLLLNCANCTLDLRPEAVSEPLQAHQQTFRITKLAPVTFEPGAECPLWQQFLAEIFAADEALIGFMQRLAGYMLFGGNPEQVIAFLWGGGANGKSTLLETLAALLGDYAMTTTSETVLARGGGSNNQVFALAQLKGARLVTISETDEGSRLAEGLVKVMTGGERINARFPRGNFFDYEPEFLPVIATNHMPELRNVDEAIRRRLLLIPFRVTIAVEDRDPQLKHKLATELPGVLSWALAGLAGYYDRIAEGKSGLAPPESVRGATEEYFAGQDPLVDFLDEACLLQTHLQCTKGALYKAYAEHCERSGRWTLRTNKFGMLVKRKLCAYYNATPQQVETKRDGRRWWLGIGLTHDASAPELGEELRV